MYLMSGSWLGLEGKVVAVTGAASGIGQGVAVAFAQQGATPVLLDRDASLLEETIELVRAHGIEPKPLTCDVGDPDSVAAAAKAAGVVDVLVNNAGISKADELADIAFADWNRVMNVNLNGVLLCSQAFGKGMLEKGAGALVHIASISGHNPQGNSGAYSASKAGVLMLSKQLALEWGPRGVRSNTISPGLTRTPLTEAYYHVGDVAERRDKAVPVGRVARANDMAQVALFLASERSFYVNGTDVLTDGGFGLTLMGSVPRPGY